MPKTARKELGKLKLHINFIFLFRLIKKFKTWTLRLLILNVLFLTQCNNLNKRSPLCIVNKDVSLSNLSGFFLSQEAFTLPDNSRYIRRAQDLICESILGMLHNMRGKESKILLIKSLGCLGHALDQDFKR